MWTCKTATPLFFSKVESSKLNTMFLTTSPRKLTKDFLSFCLHVEKIHFEDEPREPKVAKIGTFARKLITFLLWPDRELIFSIKKSFLKVIKGETTHTPGRNYRLRKKTLKWPKRDFSDGEFWLVAENCIFRPWTVEITKQIYTLPKTTSEATCNDELISFLRRLW